MAKKAFKPPRAGFVGFFVVITIGLILMLINIGLTLGITFRIPTTESNLTLLGCLGEKNKTISSLPSYAREKLGGNQNFLNHSWTMTIGPIEGCKLFILGKQENSPALGLIINVK